jgi:hypothetical protein
MTKHFSPLQGFWEYLISEEGNKMTKQQLLELYDATPEAKALYAAEASHDLACTALAEEELKLRNAGLAARDTPQWKAYITAHLLGMTYGGTR